MKKRIISLIGAFTLVMSLCACGSEATYADAAKPDADKTDLPAYREIYAAQIEELVTGDQADLFALIYVDDDEIPELAAVNSEGSWDKDQVFLYSIAGKKAVLLAHDIGPGMEGHSISYFEKQNVFMQSGSATGENYVFSKIENGNPEKITSVSWFEMPDANGDYIEKYTVDDKEVSDTDYSKALKDALPSGEMTVLADTETANMVKYDVTIEDGYMSFTKKDEIPYFSYDEIMSQLKQ